MKVSGAAQTDWMGCSSSPSVAMHYDAVSGQSWDHIRATAKQLLNGPSRVGALTLGKSTRDPDGGVSHGSAKPGTALS